MGFLGRFFKKRKGGIRGFSASDISRLTNSWTVNNNSIDADLKGSLTTVRGRSRDMALNNNTAKRFLQMVGTHVVGPRGVGLQVRAKEQGGHLDTRANDTVEQAWSSWGSGGNPDVVARESWSSLQQSFVKAVARDGEVLDRIVKGYDNRFKFALQLIDADHLDIELNQELESGNKIKMGVELNRYGKPVAYWLLTDHPGETPHMTTGRKYERVAADEVIHGFLPTRAHQHRGIPWMHSAMRRMNDLEGFQEAAVVAARVGASKMGFFTSQTGSMYEGDDADGLGNTITSAEPGTFDHLPAGMQLQSYDPDYPHQNYAAFVKCALQEVASGLGVSYVSLASDLEGVSFSSIRSGMIEEQAHWKILQNWLIDSLCQPIFEKWLEYMLITNQIDLPVAKFDKFNAANWQPVTWKHVDPLKEVNADIKAVQAGFKTHKQVVAENGGDIDEMWAELQREKEMAEHLGLSLQTVITEETENEG